MKNEKIGFGLVGTGMAGLTHAREMRFVEGAELVAVCSRDSDRVAKFANEWNVPKWYTDYHDLVDDPAVDVVCVLNPTGLHGEVTIARCPVCPNVGDRRRPEVGSRQTERITHGSPASFAANFS